MGSSRIFESILLFSFIAALGAAAQTRELWCVANNNAEDAALQSAIDWACGFGGADCGPIQNGGPCYDASDLQRTASYAFNDYYRKNGGSDDSCYFSNTASLIDLNPSHGNCKFPSSSSTGIGNSNYSGSTALGSDSSNLSSSGSVTGHHWVWASVVVHLFLTVIRIF